MKRLRMKAFLASDSQNLMQSPLIHMNFIDHFSNSDSIFNNFPNNSYYGVDNFMEISEHLLRNNLQNNIYSLLVFDFNKSEEINTSCQVSLPSDVVAQICSILKKYIKEPNLYCYMDENFTILLENFKSVDVAILVIQLSEEISDIFSSIEVKPSFGINITDKPHQNISDLYKGACYAKSTIKGKNQRLLANYTELITRNLQIISF